MGIASNRSQPFQEQLETLGLDSDFECMVAAGEINSWKPDPVIFQHALHELGAEPGKTVYVGDNYYADVIGAQRAGLQPILLDPQGLFPEADCPLVQTVGELKSLFVK